jgi:hypothetical protein
MKPIHPSPKQGEETSPQGLAGALGHWCGFGLPDKTFKPSDEYVKGCDAVKSLES